jgi:peptide/nickel transport system permease protein
MSRSIVRRLKSPFLMFIYKKLLVLVGVFIFSATLLFVLPRLMPSNPVEMMISKILGGSGGGSIGTGGSGTGGTGQSSMAAILRQVYIQKFGLDKPVEVQFILFWKRVFTLDFGLSYSFYPSKISDILISALPWTLALVIPVPIIGFLVGNRLGSLVALKRTKIGSILYYMVLYLSTFPYYWFAMVLIFIFSSELGWFPPCRAYSEMWLKPAWNNNVFIIDVLHHYALPFFSLVSQGIGGWAVGMRASMSSQLKSTYVEYSKQLGFSFNRIRKYMERNAILPNFTWLPMSFAGLISQTLLVEVVFAYPGLGSLMYNAVFSLDYPLLEATFLVTMLVVLIGNFVCDILYGILNPAIGSAYVSEGAA